MKHIMKFTEWQGGSRAWFTGDCTDLAKNSNAWYNVPRMLEIPLEQYLPLLLKYKATIKSFNNNLLYYYWKDYNDCHKFTLFVNKEAKKRHFYVG